MTDSRRLLPESLLRRRVRERMKALLVMGTAVGAAACGDGASVDPLPPPLRCGTSGNSHGIASRIAATASWAASDSGLVARMRLQIALYRDDAPLSFVGGATVSGGTLVRVTRQDRVLDLDVLPDADAASIDVSIPLSCDLTPACHRIQLDVRQPRAGSSIPLLLLGGGC